MEECLPRPVRELAERASARRSPQRSRSKTLEEFGSSDRSAAGQGSLPFERLTGAPNRALFGERYQPDRVSNKVWGRV